MPPGCPSDELSAQRAHGDSPGPGAHFAASHGPDGGRQFAGDHRFIDLTEAEQLDQALFLAGESLQRLVDKREVRGPSRRPDRCRPADVQPPRRRAMDPTGKRPLSPRRPPRAQRRWRPGCRSAHLARCFACQDNGCFACQWSRSTAGHESWSRRSACGTSHKRRGQTVGIPFFCCAAMQQGS
jgi:hypothetical protein